MIIVKTGLGKRREIFMLPEFHGLLLQVTEIYMIQKGMEIIIILFLRIYIHQQMFLLPGIQEMGMEIMVVAKTQ